ncbi:MAG: phage holin family protein [Bacteroides sp.]|nr:phage holin family protein [Bacteroides sp.]
MNLNPLSRFIPSSDDSENSAEAYRRIFDEVRRLVNLEVEDAKLMLTEKLTLLLGRVTLVAVAFVLSVCVVIFLSMSISDLLLKSFSPWVTYLIVALFYAVLVGIVALFRRQLIVDPIARYISQVILDPKPKRPSNSKSDSNSAQEK